jgi:DNA topoisomerase IA
MSKGIKGKKVDKYFPTEESILNFLGFKYVKPEDRVDGRQLQPFTESSKEEEFSEEELLEALEKLEIEDQSKKSVVIEKDDTNSDDEYTEEALLKALES